MWVSKQVYALLVEWKGAAAEAAHNYNEQRCVNHELLVKVQQLQLEVVRHVADKDWFKLRLNQVEQERAQLIYAATGGYGQVPAVRTEGVKIAAPRFAEGPPLSETLNHQYNPFGTLGEDSIDPDDQIPGHTGENFSHLPGYKS